MAPVDLARNKESMLKAHREVSDLANPTNWALFGYEGQTDVLKFVSKGDGGIPELIDELNSGRMMYAYLKILDPNTNLNKFVFVNWPEGVPENRKGTCASHVRDVEKFLHGAHLTINARTEDDVDEELVKSKVSKASGANYSFHKEKQRPMPEITPVGSVYQKTKPQVEIKSQTREEFWEQTQKEEANRLVQEKKRRNSEKEQLDKEIKDRELQSAKAREAAEAERARAIRSIREVERQASTTSITSQPSFDVDDARRSEEERGKRSEQMRKERAAEAKSLASGRTTEARSMFEQKPTSQFDQPSKTGVPTRKLKSSFLDESSNGHTAHDPTAGRKQPIKLPGRDPDDSEPTSPGSPPARQTRAGPVAKQTGAIPTSPPAQQPPSAKRPDTPPSSIYDDTFSGAAVLQPPSRQQAEPVYNDAAPVHKDYVAPQSPPVGVQGATQPAPRNLLAQGLPKRPASDDEEEQEDQDWDDKSAALAVSHVSPQAHAPTTEDFTPTPAAHQAISPQQGLTAKALYDYQAAEENEITFDPDDVITDIDQIDEGWWMGTAPDGTRGMFPSNYVELI